MHARATFKRGPLRESRREPAAPSRFLVSGLTFVCGGGHRKDSAQDAFLGIRTGSLQLFQPYAWIAAGLGLGLISLVYRRRSGYSKTMLWLWLAACVERRFGLASRTLPRIALADVGIGAGLAALAAPLYLLALYRWPVQVSADESRSSTSQGSTHTAPGSTHSG